MKTNFLIIILFTLLISACSDDEKNPVQPESGTSITVHSTNYVLESIHDSYFGENYNINYRTFSLEIKFEQPDFLDKMKRMIIYDDGGRDGWDFSKEELKEKLSDSFNGFKLNHLILPSLFVADGRYTITIYGYDNEILDEYDFVVNYAPLKSFRTSYNWYDKNSLSMVVYDYSAHHPPSALPDSIKIVYLNNKEIVGDYLHTEKDFNFIAPNVPSLANSFFLKCYFQKGKIFQISISEKFSINEKIPNNAILLPDNIKIDNSILSEDGTNLILHNQTDQKIYYWNLNSKSLSKEINLPSIPTCMKLHEGSVYIGSNYGAIYKINENGDVTTLHDFGNQILDIIIIKDKIVATVNYEEIYVFDLEEKTATKYENYATYNLCSLVYNENQNVIYGKTTNVGPADIHRMNYNSETGEISNYNDSRYHGDYSLGNFLELFPGEDKIITSTGTIFSSSENYIEDLVYLGSINEYFNDISFSSLGNIVLIYSNEPNYNNDSIQYGILKVIDPNSFNVKKSIDLFEFPFAMHKLNDDYLIITKISKSERYFYQILDKDDIESRSMGKINPTYKKYGLN